MERGRKTAAHEYLSVLQGKPERIVCISINVKRELDDSSLFIVAGSAVPVVVIALILIVLLILVVLIVALLLVVLLVVLVILVVALVLIVIHVRHLLIRFAGIVCSLCGILIHDKGTESIGGM